MNQQKPTDMRAYRKRSERNMVIGVVALFLVVGTVIIGLVYDWAAVFTALICLVPGVGAFVLIWLFLNGLERFLE
ncbi:MAG: hypothetical protein JXA33_21305 [Anaerolineae bacterium]|nr:hypothetical protein [Anaerolineae bacterium]